MKQCYAVLLLTIAALFSGCLKQNWDLCPLDGNCTLEFRLDEGGNNILNDRINSVDVALFDTGNNFVAHRRLEKAELMVNNTVTFTVDPGDYRVVCWGNVLANSTMTVMDANAVMNLCCVETVSPKSGCPLYYAPFKSAYVTRFSGVYTRANDHSGHTITIPPRKRVTKVMEFARAHRSVNVYVKGFDDIVGLQNIPATVEITKLPRRYDFFLNVDPARIDFKQQASPVSTPGGIMTLAKFNSPFYDIKNDIVINVYKTSDGSLAHTLNLLNHITTYALTNLDDIDILLEFDVSNTVVNVVLPNWNPSSVDPIW